MDTKRKDSSPQIDCKKMKPEDLLQFSNVFASEFNNSVSGLHDCVLVFQTIKERRQDEELSNTSTSDLTSKKCAIRSDTILCNQDQKSRMRKSEIGKEGEGEEEEGEEVNRDKGEKDADEVVLSENKVFVHSCWLAVQSPYFRALFCSEKSHSKEVVIKISENELQAHLTLIEAMYRLDVLDEKESNLVLDVLILANRYDVNLVIKKCKYVLISTSLTLEKCEHILTAVKYLTDCADLLNVVEKFLVKEFTPLDMTWTMNKFTSLSEASLRLLFSSNNLAVQSENTIFVALMSWVGANITARSVLTKSSLLSLVKFELMTVDFLFDVVRHNVVAKEMLGFSNFLQNGLGYHGFSQERRDKLKDKPVQRAVFIERNPTFSWAINKNARERLLASKTIQSNQFWFQGYQMQLRLSYTTDTNTFEYFLCAPDLEKGSCVNIRWATKSNLFKKKLFQLTHMFTHDDGMRWGLDYLESDILVLEVPEGKSHTIDVWLQFN